MSSTESKLALKKLELEQKRERLRHLKALRAKKKQEADMALGDGMMESSSIGSVSPRTTDDGSVMVSPRSDATESADAHSVTTKSGATRVLHMTELMNLIDLEPTVQSNVTSVPATEKIYYSKGVEVDMAELDAMIRAHTQDSLDAEDDDGEDEPMDEDDFVEKRSNGTTRSQTPRLDNDAQPSTPAQSPQPILTKEQIQQIESSTEYHTFLLQGTKYVERILNQKFDPLVDYTITRVKKTDDKEILSREETFLDDFSKERTVMAFDWSTLKPELFLVAYAEKMMSRSTKDTKGGVLIWSRFLPTRPEFELHASSQVTKALFHPFDVNLVFGGTKAGQILQWDLSVASHPIQQTPVNPEYHTNQICGLRLVGTRSSPTIMSLCTDGMFCSWSLSNGFAKPVQKFHISERATKSTTLGICASVYCFSFPTDQELSRFYAGTESGTIYSSEIYVNAKLDREFLGHYGPVMSIDFHPSTRFKDLMLTCSVDWSVRLWSTKHSDPLHVFSEYADYVYDVKWSPVHPAVFATVDGEGCLKVWNLDKHRNMPIYSKMLSETPTRRSLHQLLFSPDGSTILVGGIGGDVQLLRLEESLWKMTGEDQYAEFVNWRKKLEMR